MVPVRKGYLTFSELRYLKSPAEGALAQVYLTKVIPAV
jgi:hypothetical protein